MSSAPGTSLFSLLEKRPTPENLQCRKTSRNKALYGNGASISKTGIGTIRRPNVTLPSPKKIVVAAFSWCPPSRWHNLCYAFLCMDLSILALYCRHTPGVAESCPGRLSGPRSPVGEARWNSSPHGCGISALLVAKAVTVR